MQNYLNELRLFLEEICCELCRFRHVAEDRLAPEQVQLNREVYLGIPGAYADIRVKLPNQPAYFVEIKYGYAPDRLLRHLARKYATETPVTAGASKVVLVVDAEKHANWPQIAAEAQTKLRPGMKLEIWNEQQLLAMLRERFGVDLKELSVDQLTNLRNAIDNAKWQHAFGDGAARHPLQNSLLWHFGFWRLRQLREAGMKPENVLPPSHYPEVAVILADLCSFSSFVRDTRDDAVTRNCLMTFYSCARFEILNAGGMMYQFVGDEVIGLFGIPDRQPGYIQRALDCALRLADVGNSVSHHWQRQIDRVQSASGVHIGMAVGDLEILSLRPFDCGHMGGVGDCINMAARLRGAAGPSEIVVSNTFHRNLDEETQSRFEEQNGLDARNVGAIKCWKMRVGAPGA